MPFRDESQHAAVCRSLCRLIGRPDLWTGRGPARLAKELLEADGGALPADHRIILLLAWALWNKRVDVTVTELIRDLHGDLLAAVSGLMIAISKGHEAIDAWVLAQPGGAHDAGKARLD